MTLRRNQLLFIAFACLASGMQVIGYLLDTRFSDGLGWYSIGCKAVIILICLLFLHQAGRPHWSSYSSSLRTCVLYVLLVSLLIMLIQFRIPNICPDGKVILAGFLGVATTVLWEELYYRAIGVHLLSPGGSLSNREMLFLIIVFSLSHAVNLVGGNVLDTALTVILAFGLGFLLLALYLKTQSLLLPCILHYLINMTSALSGMISTHPPLIGGTAQLILFPVLALLALVLGKRLMRKRT